MAVIESREGRREEVYLFLMKRKKKVDELLSGFASLDEIADELGISATELYYGFQRYLPKGVPLGTYYREIKAKKLMEAAIKGGLTGNPHRIQGERHTPRNQI